MPKLPTVAIIGRPNTGKSTLFNRIVGERLAIENEVAGTTRDQIAAKVLTDELDFLLIDTGGIGGGSTDKDLEDDVEKQSILAVTSADLIIFTVNGKEELTASDQEVISILRKKRKSHVPVVLAVTKCDSPSVIKNRETEYESLDIAGDTVFLSATHNIGIGELTDVITTRLKELHFTKEKKEEPAEGAITAEPPRIAFIGTPNVGKSSLVNALMSDAQRKTSPRIVSEIPGTTRDASDTVVKFNEKDYVFVDTAGLRRKSRVEADIEYFSNLRSIKAIVDSDIVVLVLDAKLAISKQEKRIAAMAISEGKGMIILVNKCDMIDGDEKAEKQLEIKHVLRFCQFSPVLFTSALTRENLPKIFTMIETVTRNRARRISVRDLRRWFEGCIQRLPSHALSQCKFITQGEEVPPTFVFFVRHAKAVNVTQLRYLENSLRQTFSFEGTPIRMITKQDEQRAERKRG